MTNQAVRDAVVMPFDIDVIVEGHAALLPLSEDVRMARQGLHCRPVECLKDTASRARQALEGAQVELVNQRSDRRVEFLQTEELLMP